MIQFTVNISGVVAWATLSLMGNNCSGGWQYGFRMRIVAFESELAHVCPKQDLVVRDVRQRGLLVPLQGRLPDQRRKGPRRGRAPQEGLIYHFGSERKQAFMSGVTGSVLDALLNGVELLAVGERLLVVDVEGGRARELLVAGALGDAARVRKTRRQ